MSKANLSIGVMIATLVAVMALFFWPQAEGLRLTIATIVPGGSQAPRMLEGTAIAGEQQLIIAPTVGRIDKVYVKSGDRVQAGQLLARMDTQLEENALLQMDQQWYRWSSLAELSHGTDGTGLDLATNLIQQRAQLVAAIECKQIRAATDGIIENMHVVEGTYLSEPGMIGSLVGQQPKVTALWMAQQGQAPAPGMEAWWCASDGERIELLVLESVGAPVAQNNAVVYPLIFASLMGESSSINSGDTAPVCLLMNQQAVPAVAPVEAIDENGRLWLLRDGAAFPVLANGQSIDGDCIQVQPELLGEQVILRPDDLSLQEGMAIRQSEGM